MGADVDLRWGLESEVEPEVGGADMEDLRTGMEVKLEDLRLGLGQRLGADVDLRWGLESEVEPEMVEDLR